MVCGQCLPCCLTVALQSLLHHLCVCLVPFLQLHLSHCSPTTASVTNPRLHSEDLWVEHQDTFWDCDIQNRCHSPWACNGVSLKSASILVKLLLEGKTVTLKRKTGIVPVLSISVCLSAVMHVYYTSF